MPIAPELRQYYAAAWHRDVRPRILARAGNCCEQCGVPNRQVVLRSADHPGWWFDLDGKAHSPTGGTGPRLRNLDGCYLVRIVLTVAHLNHQPGDDRDQNLRALCQRCHLMWDLDHHRATRSSRKDRGRPLLEVSL